jgi:DNA-directed RNA polymerase specialized sigma24 family protein
MNDNNNDDQLTLTALSDLATVLKSQGMSDKEVADILLKVVTEVEIEVVEELMESLPEEKRKLLQQMSDQNKSTEEITEALQLDREEIRQLEMQIFAEVVQDLLPSLKN